MVPLEGYLVKFVQLLVEPFRHFGQVWLGLVPLYVALLLDEIVERRVSFGQAIANGFVMLWAGVNWTMHLANVGMFSYLGSSKQRMVVAWTVTACALAIGVFTILLGIRRKDKTLAYVLGHARFSGYFLIMLYPMQTGMIAWNWPSLIAVLLFALPCWLLLYLSGLSLRRLIR